MRMKLLAMDDMHTQIDVTSVMIYPYSSAALLSWPIVNSFRFAFHSTLTPSPSLPLPLSHAAAADEIDTITESRIK